LERCRPVIRDDKDDALRRILAHDARYRAQAYPFVLEALDFTIQRRGQGRKHVTGGELLEGFRDHAIETFGYLARAVLREWGIVSTDDVGAVVFNLIDEDLLQKTADDRREDFHAVYDFDEAFADGFERSLANVAL
jgi:uncharacterized repeat protein (TIGR04138 family)